MQPHLHAVLLVGATLLASLTPGPASAAEKRPGMIVNDEADAALRVKSELQLLEETFQSWAAAPLYQRLCVAEQVLPALVKGDAVELRGYKWARGTHDLSRIAGRAAWAFERLTGASLDAVVTPESGPAELLDVQREAKKLFLFFRATALATAAECPPPPVAQLKEKYRGRITPDVHGEVAFTSRRAMEELLAEWFPLGKELKDLEEIVGSRARRDNDAFIFRFDTGVHGVIFKFVVEEGIIRSVSLIGIS